MRPEVENALYVEVAELVFCDARVCGAYVGSDAVAKAFVRDAVDTTVEYISIVNFTLLLPQVRETPPEVRQQSVGFAPAFTPDVENDCPEKTSELGLRLQRAE